MYSSIPWVSDWHSCRGSDLMEKNWTGVGTGDVYDTMFRAAQTERLAFDPLWEGKPHNQFCFTSWLSDWPDSCACGAVWYTRC